MICGVQESYIPCLKDERRQVFSAPDEKGFRLTHSRIILRFK